MVLKRSKALEFDVDIMVEPDGSGFHAYCPALKGLHMDGETEDEALQNATEAAVLYLQSMIKHGEAIPLASAEKTAPARRSRKHTRRLEVPLA